MVIDDITGHLLLVMAPSGSGKNSLIKHIQSKFSHVTHTISCTTRTIRPQETEGVEYCFLTHEEFQKKVSQGEFIEWVEYGGNLYGTLQSELQSRLQNGEVVISEVEVQGVTQLLDLVPKEHRTVIYIEAGSWETLKKRIQARAPMSEVELALRHTRYLTEVASKDLADVIVYNREGELEAAQAHVEEIVGNIIKKITS